MGGRLEGGGGGGSRAWGCLRVIAAVGWTITCPTGVVKPEVGGGGGWMGRVD